MDSRDSDDFVGEKKVKESVLGRYELFVLNVANLFQMTEFFIAVALIFWSSSRLFSVLKLSGENLLSCSSNLLNQHVVFLVGIVIIAVCYVLSRCNDEGSRSEKEVEKYTYSAHRKTSEEVSIGESVTPLQVEAPATAEAVGEENVNQERHHENAVVKLESQTAIKQIESTGEETTNELGHNENAVVKSASETAIKQIESTGEQNTNELGHNENAVVKSESETAVESTGEESTNEEGHNDNAVVKAESETALQAAIKQAVKQIERFRRTQSEKLKREMSIKPRRELQRSATARKSLLLNSSPEMVEKLSNEEFRLAVETFIAKQQRLLKQQSTMVRTATTL